MAVRTRKMRKTRTRSRKLKRHIKTRKNNKCKTCYKKLKNGKRKKMRGG